MSDQSSAIQFRSVAVQSGTLLAVAGVACFSLSFPATAWALEGFGPWTATGLRGVLAALVAGACLVKTRTAIPERRYWPALAVVAAGCVIGFPLLTTLALQTSSTAHSAVVIGILPLATAAISAVRTGKRLSWVFWAAAIAGASTVIAFTIEQSHGRPTLADGYLLGAVLVCAAGYAEGGRLSSHLPGWQVIAWAVVAALPVTALTTALALPAEPVHLTAKAVVGPAYIAGISQFGGFVVWYRGMAAIGVARASQIQLAQPLLTLVWSALLMGEHLSAAAPIPALLVLSCIAVTQRAGRRK